MAMKQMDYKGKASGPDSWSFCFRARRRNAATQRGLHASRMLAEKIHAYITLRQFAYNAVGGHYLYL